MAAPVANQPRALQRGLLGPQAKPRWLRKLDQHLDEGTVTTFGTAVISVETARISAEYIHTCSPAEQARLFHMIVMWRPRNMRPLMAAWTRLRQRTGNSIRHAMNIRARLIMHPTNGVVS